MLRSHLALIVLCAALPGAALAADVAIAPPTGPKKSGLETIEKAVRVKMLQQGLRLVSESALASAAKKLKDKESAPEVGKAAGADLLVVITTKKAGKKHTVVAKLYSTRTGDLVLSANESFPKGGAQKAGERVGEKLAEAASSFDALGSGGGGGRAASEDSGSKRVVVPKDEAPAGGAAPVEASRIEETPKLVPKDEEKSESSASATVERSRPTRGGENKLLHLTLGLGSQVTSAYTVAVGTLVTGLAYTLSPLVMVNAGASVVVPNVGLGFEANFAFVPVKYSIDVEPSVEPVNPGGRFINFQGLAFYQLALARFGGDGRFYLAPLAGISYVSLSVEAQTPYPVVVSWSSVAPALGLRLGLNLGTLTLEAEGRANLVVSYAESPKTTGSDGGGLGLTFGAVGRYWVADNFGLSLGVSYDFMRISLKGDGDRPAFADDPPLRDATVFTGNLKTSLGAVLAI